MTHRSPILELQPMLLSPSIGILMLLNSSHHLTTLYRYERIQLLAQKLSILMLQIKIRYGICSEKWGSVWGLHICSDRWGLNGVYRVQNKRQILQKNPQNKYRKKSQENNMDNFALTSRYIFIKQQIFEKYFLLSILSINNIILKMKIHNKVVDESF